jgi:ketosteroid isomerase-like protein
MSIATTKTVFDQFKRAAEAKDISALVSLYAADAEIVDINKREPPASPRRVRGTDELRKMYDSVPKELVHRVGDEVLGDDRMAFSYRCDYPNGQKVFGVHICELRDGKIAREVVAEAWDE